MCGITGFFNVDGAVDKTRAALNAMQNRGIDGSGIAVPKLSFAQSPAKLKAAESNNAVGHILHSVVGAVRQPVKGRGILSANCEIYNWKTLAADGKIMAKNDAELVLSLLDSAKSPTRVLSKLDGVFALAYWSSGKVILVRDILGVKPLWYSLENGLCFASERKALKAAGCLNAIELDPRQILVFDIGENRAKFIERKFFDANCHIISKEKAVKRLGVVLRQAVQKRIPDGEFGLFFSGGVDSVVLAKLFIEMGLKFRCFFAFASGLGQPKDLQSARKAAAELGLELETIAIESNKVPKILEKLVPLIESSDPVRVGVALPLFIASKAAKKHGIKVIFSGLGADELFCGYSRFKESNNLGLDSVNLLLQMHENDLYRDDVLSMNNSLELRLPYLDLAVVKFALSLSPSLKIYGERNKVALRMFALSLNISSRISLQKKRAAQYGSNFDKAIGKLAKNAGAKGKGDYLLRFAKRKNLKLASLFSGGKDSCLSLWIMQCQNYEVSCLVSIIPLNPDSFMYHKPDVEVLELQSKSLGIPLLVEHTEGKKELELAALTKALREAKKKFGIQGVVSGALYSNYQRERIRKICTSLGLKLFSPLWHKKQKSEMHELVDSGFAFIMTKIAAFGLDKEWLGKPINKNEIAALERLNEKVGFNLAGEGGEFESIVLDAPNFSKKLKIVESKKKMSNEFTGILQIHQAKLVNRC